MQPSSYLMQVRFCFWMTSVISFVCFCLFFVCCSSISGTAKRICAKFTVKTYLDTRSEDFECQGQRPKVKVTRDKNELSPVGTPPPAAYEWYALAANSVEQQWTTPFGPCRGGVISGAVRAVCFWYNIVSSSFKLFYLKATYTPANAHAKGFA